MIAITESRVELMSSPENLKKIIYTAYRTCYSPDGAGKIWDTSVSPEKMLDLILKFGGAHDSPLEHAQFTFTIDGISRAATHQIVRHRHMSFSQKSQRYVTEKGQFNHFVPDSILQKQLDLRFNEFMGDVQDYYDELISMGIPAEDARYILPNAATSSMVASLNLRELIHLANERLCTRAQKEIRVTVKKMCELVIKKEPWLAPFLAPKCFRLGYCEEHNSCLSFPRKVEHGKTYWKAGE